MSWRNVSICHGETSASTVNTIHAQSTLSADYDTPSRLSFQTGVSPSKLNEEEGDVNTNEQQQQWSWYPPHTSLPEVHLLICHFV